MAISLSSFGQFGFANQLFQYAFLKIYAQKHHLDVQVPHWDGAVIFGHQDPPLTDQFPKVYEKTSILEKAVFPNSKDIYDNVDFNGFFQYHTRYYVPYRDYFRSLFQPIKEFQVELDKTFCNILKHGTTLVCIHLRRGDFGWGTFWIAPNSWYLNWLKDLWPTLSSPVLFIASDSPDEVGDDFLAYHPLFLKEVISVPQYYDKIGYYFDFWILSHCDYLAISNSSFSFAASMLNKKTKCFFRPHFKTQGLLKYDPWNSEVRLRGTIAPTAFQNLVENQSVSSEVIWDELKQHQFLDDDGFLTEKFKQNPSQKLGLDASFSQLEPLILERLQWILKRFAMEI